MSTQPVTPQRTLAQMVRAKYPGAYDDMNDSALEDKVLAKYPEYSDLPRTQTQPINQPTGSISAGKTGAGQWLQDAQNDVRYGGTTTLLGRMLKAAGAPGVNRGVSEETANQVAGPLLGSLTAAQGVSRMGKQPVSGGLQALGGLLQAGSLPMAFVAPEAAEAGANAIPNAQRAGEAFSAVMSAAKDVPTNIDAPMQTVQQIVDLASRGGRRPKVVTDLIKRAADTDKGPITYQELRDFASNAGELAVDEKNALKPKVKRLVTQLGQQLDQSNAQAAQQAGVGDQYQSAMSEYAKAKRFQDLQDMIKQGAIKAALNGIPQAAGGAATGYILGKMLGQR